MADVHHTLEEVIGRLRQGFYPYFDRDNKAFYWDRDATRSIIELTPRVTRKASAMLAGITEDYRIAWNNAPHIVIANLRDERIKEETWVNDEVEEIYELLRLAGLLQTVEAYDSSGVLCGALLGMRLENAFMAETMYHISPNASKACLCHSVLKLAAESVPFLDVQVAHQANHPVHRLGESTMPLENYLRRLHEATPSYGSLPQDLRGLQRFPAAKSDWRDACPVLVEGRRGKTLYICGFQMVQDWEEPLLKKMGSAVSCAGSRILEIGFGLGISAQAVQQTSPALHVIVEANRDTAESARCRFADAVNTGRVVVVNGFWQDVVANWPDGPLPAGTFDGIVFDPYPLSTRELRRPSFDFFPWAAQLLAAGGRFTYYSDEPNELGSEHLAHIQKCFGNANITTESIDVQPWPECEYWEASTILHVVIEKKGKRT